jgi:uncharacterized protein (TIRG00374 family)
VFYIDIETLRQSIVHANVVYLLIGIVLAFGNAGIQFIRWRYVLKLISNTVSNDEIFSSLFIGFSAGFFTPGQVGEHGGRMVTLSSLQAIQVLAVSLIDKLYMLALTVIAGVIGAWLFFMFYLPQYWTPWMTVLVVLTVLSSLIIVLYPDLLKKIIRMFLHRLRKYRAVSAFLFMKDVFHRRQAREMLFLTIVFYAIVLAQYHFFVRAFEPVSFDVSAICASSLLFTKSVILPISFSDLGIRESTAIFFFSRAGISAAAAFNASMCVFFVNIFFPSLLGALLIFRLKSAKGKGSS